MTLSPSLPEVTPQIQVCLNCNQNCTYCFQRHQGKVISLDTVESILKKTVRFNSRRNPSKKRTRQTVYWHGGEPLLAGVDFFKGVIKIQSELSNVSFENLIQTNGTLMTESFARFFASHQFDVGFSLDGPEHLHNLHRRYAASANGERRTFVDVVAGIDRYRDAKKIDKIPVICVITKESMRYAKEIFHFFKQMRASVQLDIYDIRTEDICLAHNEPSKLFHKAPEEKELGHFLIKLFDFWFHDTSDQVDFKDLRNEVKMVLQPEMDLGDPFNKRRCDIRRTIFAPDGNVYSCDQYLNDSRTALGNIETDDLEQIISQKMQLWEGIKSHIRCHSEQMACNECRWGRSCNGGCITCMKYNAKLIHARMLGMLDEDWIKTPEDAELTHFSGEFYYCKALKSLRHHIEKSIAEIMPNN